MPQELKAVALFLLASAVVGLAVGAVALVQPHLGFAQGRLRSFFWTWNVITALAALILAIGVWRRQRWAWWGGFGLLASSLAGPILLGVTPWPEPPLMRWVFAGAAWLVTGLWGHWWYAQRKHFLPR